MDVSGVSSGYAYPTLPSAEDLAAVLAARPAVTEQTQKAAAAVVTATDKTAEAITSASSTKVDMYL
jgi:hypothetical protein